MQKRKRDIVVAGGIVQTTTYFLLMILVVSYFTLQNLDSNVDFNSTILFMMIFILIYGVLVALATQDKFAKKLGGKNAILFFQHDVTLGKLFWVPTGIIGAFAFSVLVSNIGMTSSDSALYAVMGSGFIMMAIFIRTKAILIPILIHGAFNSLVIIFSSPAVGFQVLASTPIPIPEIGIQIGTLNALASESIFQFFIVAPSEEMLKMGAIALVLLLFKDKFDPKSWQFYAGAIFAVVFWASLHLLKAIPGQ